MATTNDAQLNDNFQMLWMDGTAGFATASLGTDETVFADAYDLLFRGPADVDDEDDLEDDEDLDEEDEDDEEDDLDEDDDVEDEEDDDEDDLDEDEPTDDNY